MDRQISPSESVGKTVRGMLIEFEYALISFDDGTFVGLRATEAYGSAYVAPHTIELLEFPRQSVIDLRLASSEELDALFEWKRKDAQERHDAAERKRYEVLRAKFEAPNGDTEVTK